MIFNRGDVILIPFPYSDLTGFKKRPALILSNKNLKGKDKICCLITSNNPKDGELILKSSLVDGRLQFKSWVKAQRIFCIDERIIIKRLAKVDNSFLGQVKNKIDYFIE